MENSAADETRPTNHAWIGCFILDSVRFFVCLFWQGREGGIKDLWVECPRQENVEKNRIVLGAFPVGELEHFEG